MLRLLLGSWILFSHLPSKAAINPEFRQAATVLGAGSASEVEFRFDSAELSDGIKSELSRFVEAVRATGEIRSAKVLAWADQEYPTRDSRPRPVQMDLAAQRARGLKTFLQTQLNISIVDTYNMAERPTTLDRVFNTHVVQMKNLLESSGAIATTGNTRAASSAKGKAGKAVIMLWLRTN